MNSNKQLESLQVLRAFAALAVVVHHVLRAFTFNAPEEVSSTLSVVASNRVLQEFGAAGVDVFFILSGFIMVYITAASNRPSGWPAARQFIVDRVLRVWPLYALVTLAVCLPLFIKWVSSGVLPFDLQLARLSSFLFLPSLNDKGYVQPILGVGWTLNYEFLFYAMFAASLFFSRMKVLALVIFVIAINAVSRFLPQSSVAHQFLSNSILFEFLIGVALAKLYQKGWLVPRWLIYVLLAVGVMGLVASSYYQISPELRFVANGLPAACIFIAFLQWDSWGMRWPRWLVFLGDASYSIYLIHVLVIYHFCLAGVRFVVDAASFPVLGDLFVVATVVMAVAVGGILYVVVERPMTQRLRSMRKRHHVVPKEQATTPATL